MRNGWDEETGEAPDLEDELAAWQDAGCRRLRHAVQFDLLQEKEDGRHRICTNNSERSRTVTGTKSRLRRFLIWDDLKLAFHIVWKALKREWKRKRK